MFKLLNRGLISLMCLIPTVSIYAQSFSEDMDMVIGQVQEISHEQHDDHHHLPAFLFSESPSILVRYNPVTLAFGSLLWGYQALISPQFSATCIYSPSCSSYSKRLLQEYGIIRGIIFSADRLSRCNRLALYDYPPWEIDHNIHKIREQIDYYRLK
ncbi:MAG: membrane protein insertion efficiency factor YidD [Bacteroidales bacterium]|nr:membrane protein insertion efficiency factor YidD [Bacteroidales bacterium]